MISRLAYLSLSAVWSIAQARPTGARWMGIWNDTRFFINCDSGLYLGTHRDVDDTTCSTLCYGDCMHATSPEEFGQCMFNLDLQECAFEYEIQKVIEGTWCITHRRNQMLRATFDDSTIYRTVAEAKNVSLVIFAAMDENALENVGGRLCKRKWRGTWGLEAKAILEEGAEDWTCPAGPRHMPIVELRQLMTDRWSSKDWYQDTPAIHYEWRPDDPTIKDQIVFGITSMAKKFHLYDSPIGIDIFNPGCRIRGIAHPMRAAITTFETRPLQTSRDMLPSNFSRASVPRIKQHRPKKPPRTPHP